MRLSVNVNKVATVRNSRGGQCRPCSMRCACASMPARPASPCIRGPMRGTSLPTDVREMAALLRPLGGRVEFNIEGDPRPDLLALVQRGEADPVHAGAGAPR